MEEINIHLEDVANLFIEFIGGADYFVDDDYKKLALFDLNTHEGRISFIRNMLLPTHDKFSPIEKENFKNSLWYYKNNRPDKMKYFAERNLFPFEFPEGREFLDEIWAEFYHDETLSFDAYKLNIVD